MRNNFKAAGNCKNASGDKERCFEYISSTLSCTHHLSTFPFEI